MNEGERSERWNKLSWKQQVSIFYDLGLFRFSNGRRTSTTERQHRQAWDYMRVASEAKKKRFDELIIQAREKLCRGSHSEVELAAKSHRVTEAAIKQVEQNADEAWLEGAYQALVDTARAKALFIADDVWHLGHLPQPREPRAMGAVIRRARREQIIEPTGDHRSAYIPTRHRNPRMIWRSLIYEPLHP